MFQELLWKIYFFYAFDDPLIVRMGMGMEPGHPFTPTKKLKGAPAFRVAAKFNKRLLDQDNLWKLFRDFEFVPFVIK